MFTKEVRFVYYNGRLGGGVGRLFPQAQSVVHHHRGMYVCMQVYVCTSALASGVLWAAGPLDFAPKKKLLVDG
jgi:hypothetical protein